MFHGNAGNIGHRIPIAKVLADSLHCNVLMLEYRGYGESTGTPDENGLKVDGQTGLDFLRQLPETKDTKILVYGQSLGGAVAIHLVANNQKEGDIAGLILENTFQSVRKLIPRYGFTRIAILPYVYMRTALTDVPSIFPAAKYLTRLCHQQWASDEMLPKITDIPIIFLSGLKDEIIPCVAIPAFSSQIEFF